mmetsp:Transcript_42477/g.62050  ORF Transcript_42477/g.62050 Transcript_42477/m.62050 type:complete len:511 (-) Transcript_42477:425-1957(-)
MLSIRLPFSSQKREMSEKREISNSKQYTVEEGDKPKPQDGRYRMTLTKSGNAHVTSAVKGEEPSVMDGPPFCMSTASRALYLSTLVYLEPNTRGLTPEKYEALFQRLDYVVGERGLEIKEFKEFYNKTGKDEIRCICFAMTKKKENIKEDDQDENEETKDSASSGEGEKKDEGTHEMDGEKNMKKHNVSKSKFNRIFVCFRGTDTAKNVVADIKAWTVPHPPVRGSVFNGSRPMVHHGFLNSWRNDKLSEQVLDFVKKHVKEMRESELEEMEENGSNGSPWPVLTVTGHSLGGSIATLASWDIASELQDMSLSLAQNHSSFAKKDDSILSQTNTIPFPKENVRLYSFGCPRVGNGPFADSFNDFVPNAWNIIHDNDIVPAVPAKHSGFLGQPFQRAGRQVIIKENGDFLINPSRKERRLRAVKVLNLKTSVAAHETGHYRRGLLSIFEKEGLLGNCDDEGVVLRESLSKGEETQINSLKLAAESLDVMGQIITDARNDPSRSFRVLPGAT